MAAPYSKASSPVNPRPELLRRLLRAKDRMDAAPDQDWPIPRLAELSYGSWEGFSWQEIEVTHPTALADWRADPHGYCPPGGETHHALRQRSAAVLAEIAASGMRTVVVGHGVSGAVLRGINLGLDFTGGTLIEVTFTQAIAPDDVRAALQNADLRDTVVQNFGTERDILIRVPPEGGRDAAARAVERRILGDQHRAERPRHDRGEHLVDDVGPMKRRGGR